jgi:hypothetical protein
VEFDQGVLADHAGETDGDTICRGIVAVPGWVHIAAFLEEVHEYYG